MIHSKHAALILAGCALAAPALAAEAPTVRDTLQAQQGKRATVRVDGEELTGTVQAVGAQTVQLGELAGKEFFDATVRLDSIDAVIVRRPTP